MSEETILQMPCFSCEVPCLWPFDPPKTITAQVTGLFNLACFNCDDLNQIYTVEFVEKTENAGFVTCRFEFPFPLEICTVLRAKLVAQVNKVNSDLFLIFDLENQFLLPVARWTFLFTGPEKFTNGPFGLNQNVATIQCNTLLNQVIVEAA